MPKSLKIKVGNKAKGRRSAHHKLTGKYTKQAVKTVVNRKQKRLKHIRKQPNDLQTKRLLS